MEIGEELLKYLNGNYFDNSLTVEIERDKYVPLARELAIGELIRNKDVIHVGCSDHLDLINKKIENNLWLHKIVTENSKSCIGIDNNNESIEYLRNELGYSNVFFGNILSDSFEQLFDKKWDFVIFGEMIEHLDDPVTFLRTFKSRFNNYVDKFIVSVPNIFTKNHYRNMLKYKEIINSDHRYWFTPYTILKVLISAGLKPRKIAYSNLLKLNFIELVFRKFKKVFRLQPKYPFFYFNTLIITGDIN